MEIKARGLTFDVYEGGPADGEPVLLLHGFPQDHREFDLMLPRLHAAGLRTYALDQRGYSPGARPAEVADYRITEPVADAVAVLDALGLESAHVVGHDWGAQVGLAAGRRTTPSGCARSPRSRCRTRAALGAGAAGPAVAAGAVRLHGGVPQSRSPSGCCWPATARCCGDDARRSAPAPALYADAMREPGRLTGALNWYRGAVRRPDSAGVGDDHRARPRTCGATATRWSAGTAALRTADWVEADYQLVALRGRRPLGAGGGAGGAGRRGAGAASAFDAVGPGIGATRRAGGDVDGRREAKHASTRPRSSAGTATSRTCCRSCGWRRPACRSSSRSC